MPTICTFYGICIKMNFKQKEHEPPHIHAFYGEKEAMFNIVNGELLKGRVPVTATKLVKEFLNKNKDDLLKMWDEQNIYKLKGIE